MIIRQKEVLTQQRLKQHEQYCNIFRTVRQKEVLTQQRLKPLSRLLVGPQDQSERSSNTTKIETIHRFVSS